MVDEKHSKTQGRDARATGVHRRDASATGEERTEAGFYEDPSIYDILHTPGTAREVDGLERIADRFCRTKGGAKGRARNTWLEPACGTGRYLRVIAGRGKRAVGFDASEAMVAYVRERGARRSTSGIRVFAAAMESFVGPECRAGSIGFAFNLINSFRHLMTDDAALAHLSEMRRALAVGGVYVVGISVTVYGVEHPSEDVWTARRGRTGVTQIVQYEPGTPGARVEQVLSHLIIERPSGTTHVDSRYELRSYDAEEWHRLIARAGFRVAGIVDELGDDAEPTELGYRLYVLSPG